MKKILKFLSFLKSNLKTLIFAHLLPQFHIPYINSKHYYVLDRCQPGKMVFNLYSYVAF